MTNGAIDGWCVYYRTWNVVHLRVEDDYTNFHGLYCDACFDWIEADDEHWRLHALMRMADSSQNHPLTIMVSCSMLGHTLADFLRKPPWMDGW